MNPLRNHPRRRTRLSAVALAFAILLFLRLQGLAAPPSEPLPAIDQFTPEDLGVDATPRLVTLQVDEPPPRVGGGKVADVAELVDKLKNEAGVI